MGTATETATLGTLPGSERMANNTSIGIAFNISRYQYCGPQLTCRVNIIHVFKVRGRVTQASRRCTRQGMGSSLKSSQRSRLDNTLTLSTPGELPTSRTAGNNLKLL